MSKPYADRRWTSPDGLSLYARDYAPADGPAKLPVIAIHGLTRNSADFEVIAPLIAASGRRMKDCTLAEMDAIWDKIRAADKRA